MNFSDQANNDLKTKFSEELVKNVFRDERRNELSLNEADIISISRSDRQSFDAEGHLSNQDSEMRLKKTTVLTGNHGGNKHQRDRA